MQFNRTPNEPLKGRYRTPNRLDFPTEHLTFSKSADLITTGNVISNVQHSGYIRAVTDTECNGFQFPVGQLRDFDLQAFKGKMPAHVYRRVMELTQSRTVILYEFRTPYRGRQSTVHGYIVTGTDREHHELIETFVTGPTYKSRDVIDRASRMVAVKPAETASQAA